MAKVGRPTKYKEEYCELLIQHMSEGLSFETFGPSINVNTDTIYQWTYKHEEFAEAKKEGLDKCKRFYETVGRNGMLGKIPGFNVTAWIFNMKNRFGWTDRREITTVTDLDKLTDEDLDKKIAEELSKRGR